MWSVLVCNRTHKVQQWDWKAEEGYCFGCVQYMRPIFRMPIEFRGRLVLFFEGIFVFGLKVCLLRSDFEGIVLPFAPKEIII